jgi:hypothetical protein
MERLQPCVRLALHAHVVHGQDLVERLRKCRKLLGRTETEIDTPRGTASELRLVACRTRTAE